jgi:hypothetical protein
MNVRVFNTDLFTKNSVIVDFFEQISMPDSIFNSIELEIFQNRNQSLSEEAIKIGDKVICLLDGRGDSYFKKFREVITPVLEDISGCKYRLTSLQKYVIYKATKSELDFLENEFGINIKPKEAWLKNNASIEVFYKIMPQVIANAAGKIEIERRKSLTLGILETTNISVSISNKSETAWGRERVVPINISYHWYNKDMELFAFEGGRTPLEAIVEPEKKLKTVATICAPDSPGCYFLEITLVQEYCSWFEKIGFETAVIPVNVLINNKRDDENYS